MEHKTHKDTQGTILEIIRMSTEDGPGIRTTVFFKGCSLNCSLVPQSGEHQRQAADSMAGDKLSSAAVFV
ncbi:MAG: hypothetical protein MZV70_15445 [Desulfobacterales bacterium]|nr:hypothetical protein [Desulfobacterales bacterium]